MTNSQITQLQPPFFAFEGWDLCIFKDLQSLQSKLEATDIESGVYDIFDSVGSLLSFKVIEMAPNSWFDVTHKMISFDCIIKTDSRFFSDFLKKYCQEVFDVDINEMDINEIISLIIKKCGYTR